MSFNATGTAHSPQPIAQSLQTRNRRSWTTLSRFRDWLHPALARPELPHGASLLLRAKMHYKTGPASVNPPLRLGARMMASRHGLRA
jgi:hypothetical protein